MMLKCYFFFFKQKTAYEMRISDWSSDVCSSDLVDRRFSDPARAQRLGGHRRRERGRLWGLYPQPARSSYRRFHARRLGRVEPRAAGRGEAGSVRLCRSSRGASRRSEEHTSELQSLMRISYAVFCLKKKKHTLQLRPHIVIIQNN